jgi:hypothetical protein
MKLLPIFDKFQSAQQDPYQKFKKISPSYIKLDFYFGNLILYNKCLIDSSRNLILLCKI